MASKSIHPAAAAAACSSELQGVLLLRRLVSHCGDEARPALVSLVRAESWPSVRSQKTAVKSGRRRGDKSSTSIQSLYKSHAIHQSPSSAKWPWQPHANCPQSIGQTLVHRNCAVAHAQGQTAIACSCPSLSLVTVVVNVWRVRGYTSTLFTLQQQQRQVCCQWNSIVPGRYEPRLLACPVLSMGVHKLGPCLVLHTSSWSRRAYYRVHRRHARAAVLLWVTPADTGQARAQRCAVCAHPAAGRVPGLPPAQLRTAMGRMCRQQEGTRRRGQDDGIGDDD